MRGSAIRGFPGFVLFCEIEKDLFIAKKKIERKVKELRNSKRFLSRLIDASPMCALAANVTDSPGQDAVIVGHETSRIYIYSRKFSAT